MLQVAAGVMLGTYSKCVNPPPPTTAAMQSTSYITLHKSNDQICASDNPNSMKYLSGIVQLTNQTARFHCLIHQGSGFINVDAAEGFNYR